MNNNLWAEDYQALTERFRETGEITLPTVPCIQQMDSDERYRACELTKVVGWEWIKSDRPGKRSFGFDLIISAHYVRAWAALQNSKAAFRRKVYGKRYSPGYELDIDVYTNNWLHSLRNHVALGRHSKARKDFLTYNPSYKPVRNKYLPDGMTIYQEPGA